MSEKEERILIAKIKPYCKFREMHETTAGGESWVDFMCGKSKIRNLECDEKCFEQCEWKELTGISRQEAINRMAKAIFNYYTDGIEPQNWKLKEVRDNFNKVAEAALNALLKKRA